LLRGRLKEKTEIIDELKVGKLFQQNQLVNLEFGAPTF